LLDLRYDEQRDLILNEAKVLSQKEAVSSFSYKNEKYDDELAEIEKECKNIEYEINKTSREIQQHALDFENLKITVSSNDKNLSTLSVMNQKLNKSQELLTSQDYLYQEKNRMSEQTIKEAPLAQEECSFDKNKLSSHEKDNLFHYSDINTTSRGETTKHDTSNLYSASDINNKNLES
jgi:predicted nuclease with TOPRIM domain